MEIILAGARPEHHMPGSGAGIRPLGRLPPPAGGGRSLQGRGSLPAVGALGRRLGWSWSGWNRNACPDVFDQARQAVGDPGRSADQKPARAAEPGQQPQFMTGVRILAESLVQGGRQRHGIGPRYLLAGRRFVRAAPLRRRTFQIRRRRQGSIGLPAGGNRQLQRGAPNGGAENESRAVRVVKDHVASPKNSRSLAAFVSVFFRKA